jgi:diguanylate cyclase (GGDEF)-like protein
MLVVIVLGTAGVVALAGGGSAFWLSVPAALLVCSAPRTRSAAILAASLVVIAATVPNLLMSGKPPLPPAWLALIVPAGSVAITLATRRRLERERDGMRRSALTDPLTGIANRRSLLERINYEILRHDRLEHSFALVMIDLDGFKRLNDRFGHAAGDDLLREIAGALQRTLRSQDTAARIGGDEFCVLAPETDVRGLVQLESRVQQAIERASAGMDRLGASVGIALFPQDGTSADELLDSADHRLLAVKRERSREQRFRRAA